MILEVAPLQIRSGLSAEFEDAFQRAQPIIASVPGYISHELQRCLEQPDHYVLLVRWQSVAAHEQNFRGSGGYLEWKRLLHHFYDPFPKVLHYEAVHVSAGPELTGGTVRKLVSSGSPYEPKVGISRAVRVGDLIAVSGTAPLGPDGSTVGSGDAAAQARRCLEIIRAALEAAGASLKDVVRTRTLLVHIEDWQAVAAVHGEFFRDVRPANTIVQVSRFIDPEWLVEFEADAVIHREES
jgi:enamine deaminase RidA (YjgF/YER057c/UK114 family)/heme-degrading monooxygenase HmoA